ncbi:MAG TPA: TadE/TadG family type IV pilus assembly protein [Caulobacteraceae bacterium]|nr:TadE/TadG family type IV pilus assembly protein [Caulobacteraceae bacterium]
MKPGLKDRLQAHLRRFLAAREGATAVEFALIALPFFMLLFGTLQLALLFMASTTIESATVNAARQIRTGQLQTGGNNTAAAFKAAICSNMSWVSSSDCTANLSVDVRTFGTFSAINVTTPVNNGAIDTSQLQFNDGTYCSIVLVRVFYPYTIIAPTFSPGLPDLGGNKKLISFASAFRNENWGTSGNCGAP